MAFNKNKVMDAARRYVDKGQIDKAIKEYNRVVKEDPKDVRVWLKIGDLHAKKGAKAEAVDTYSKVAKFYSEQGFYLKAVAVYKQILKLDPRLIEINLKLAELYRQLGLMSDAMRQFEAVAGHFHREGKTKEALATVRQLVELDPENVATRIKLAELYSKEGMTEEAVVEFTKACDYLRENSRQDDFVKVAERLLWHKPGNMDLSRELASLYLQRKDPRRALQKLQSCFKANPRDTDTLALLAQAFQALEQKSKTVQVLKELARVFQEDNQRDKAAEIYHKILALMPNDADALAFLGKSKPAAPAAKEKVIPPATPVQPTPLAVSSKDVPPRRRHNPTGSVPLLDARQIPGVRYPSRLPSRPLSPPPSEPVRAESDFTSKLTQDHGFEATQAGEEHAEEIAKLLTETEVYIKYGLHEKAVEHLRWVFALDDDNVEARERLKDLLIEQGREEEAIAELMRLAEITAARDHEQSTNYLRELLGIDGAYRPAFALAQEFSLDITGDPQKATDLRDGGAVVAVTGKSGLGGDSYEFDLDDFADAADDGFSGAGVTRELDADEVEAMFDLIGQEDAAELLGSGERPISGDGHFPYDPGRYGQEPVANPPVFDRAAAAAFDAEPGFDPNLHTNEPYRYSPEATTPDDDFDTGFDEPARTFVYGASGVGADFTVGVAPDFVDPASTAQFGPHDYDAEPLSDLEEFAVDFGTGNQTGDRPTQDLSTSRDQIERTIQTAIPLGPDDLPGSAEIDTGLDILDEQLLAPPSPVRFSEPSSSSIEDDLDEADFYMSQQLYGDARDILQTLLKRYPEHPLLLTKLQDIDNLLGAGVDSTSANVVLPDMDFDQLDVLETIGDEDPSGLQVAQPSVFLENPVDDEDADTHYDLGLAYKEMGLYDEAVKAFKKVLESPGREVQCRLMIGLCYREQGSRTDAITQFKAGLHAPGINTSEQLMLYYEIAYSYEMVKDPKEAIYFYQLVSKRDPNYRDVGDRMAAITGNDSDNRHYGSHLGADNADADAVIDSLLADDNTNPGE